MKKLMMIFTAAAITTAAAAQENTTGKPDVKFGIRAGMNLSNISKSGDYNDLTTGSKTGFNAGVFAEIPLVTVLSIQPEVQFSQKGFKSNGTFLTNPYEYKQTINFIEVPLLVKIKPTRNFGILVGPQFSFLSSTKTQFTTANTEYENIVKEDNDNLRKNILGGVFGVEASANRFLVGLRYSMDFQKNNGDGSSTSLQYKNQVASLYVGLTF